MKNTEKRYQAAINAVITALEKKAEANGGNLTVEVIESACANAMLAEDTLDSVLVALNTKGVCIVSEDDRADIDIHHDEVEENASETRESLSTSSEMGRGVDSLKLYLKEIGKYPLLSREEEMELAEKCAEGDAVARQKMCESNFRLVVSVAKRYSNQGLSIMDLIQDGNLGLLKAVERYDCNRGARFSTYATFWIRQSITRGLADTGRTIRIPVHMNDTVRLVMRTMNVMIQETGHEPSPWEVSQRLQISEEKVKEAYRIHKQPISLDTPVGEDEESSFGDFIGDDSSKSPEEIVVASTMNKELYRGLDNLEKRERQVLEHRFGLRDGEPKTLEEVGKLFNLSRERTRQIEAKALRKMRYYAEHILQEYVA